MVYREFKDYTSECYFCVVSSKSIGKKTRHAISYPCIPLVIRSISHFKELMLPDFNGFVSSEDVGS